MSTRAAFYIDGFNLYHAINELGDQTLKWCNLWALAELLIPKNTEHVVRVCYYSAYYPGDERKRWRHEQYKSALENAGVKTKFGHFIIEPMSCTDCGRTWRRPTEKETDINLALGIVDDARLDLYDKAYIVTADSDQVATVRYVRANYPEKQIVAVAPPNRNFSADIQRFANGGRIKLTDSHIRACLFGPIVPGARAIRRPREYDP